MAETKTTKSKKKSLFAGEEMVTIKLPLNRTEKDDVWVAVNGKSMQIKRGVEVEVPKCIAEVLQHKEEMLMQAIEFESNATGKADDSELN
jgi:hypothetical protein